MNNISLLLVCSVAAIARTPVVQRVSVLKGNARHELNRPDHPGPDGLFLGWFPLRRALSRQRQPGKPSFLEWLALGLPDVSGRKSGEKPYGDTPSANHSGNRTE